MQNIESFNGSIETESDCIILIDLARKGIIPRIQRRLTTRERREIRHGSVFVYCEEESKIRRWTDDMSWTPSRVQGVFLVYRQLLNNSPMIKKTYSATCRGTSFHIVGYTYVLHSFHGYLLPVSTLYRGVDFPTDIKMKRKLGFSSEKWAPTVEDTPESLASFDNYSTSDIYEYQDL